MQITVYKNFPKRINSTKRPSSGTVINVQLKDNTSIDNPTFILESTDISINYIKAWDHYYFVDEITALDGFRFEYSCHMDVLATFKSYIQSYTGFIERSASTFDTSLPDPYVSIKQTETVSKEALSTGTLFNSTGVFVLTVINTKASAGGFTSYYIMDVSTLEKIAAYCNQNWGAGAQDLLEFFQKTVLHTADSIIRCTWLPVSFSIASAAGTTSEQVRIGADDITLGGVAVNAYRVTGNPVSNWGSHISIPHIYTDFRKGAPYTECRLYLPFVGQISVDPLDFLDDKIYISYDIDCCTGDTFVKLKDYNGSLISTFSTCIGIDCPTGKSTVDLGGALGGIAGTATGILSAAAATTGTGTAVAAIGAATSAGNALASATITQFGANGSTGGRAIAKSSIDIICTIIAKDTTDLINLDTVYGRPLMLTRSLASVSGYVKCPDASVSMPGTDAEKSQVNSLLGSGIYIE